MKVVCKLFLWAVVFLVGCNTRFDPQRDVVKKLTPASYASMSSETSTDRPVLVVRVRVLADEAYRRETMHWRERVTAQVGAASAVLEGHFGVRLQIVELEGWEHEVRSRDMSSVLRALQLATLEDATADRIIGFTSALPEVTSDVHALGVAEILGRHLVLRGMNDPMERDAIHSTLTTRSSQERDRIYRSRVRHKEATVLLHELAHSFGAMHVRSEGYIMSQIYSHMASVFTEINERIMERAFALHDALRGEDQSVWQNAVREEIAARRDAAVAEALDPRALEYTLREDGGGPLSLDEARALDEAKALAQRGSYEAAWALARPIVERRAHNEHAVFAACVIGDVSKDKDIIIQWCPLASVLQPNEPLSHAALALSAMRQRDLLVSHRHTRALEACLERSAEPAVRSWLQAAQLYMNQGALSDAERALAKVGMMREASEAGQTIALMRMQSGMFGLKPDLEPEVFAVVRELEIHTRSRNTAERDLAMSRLEALAPESAPVLLARCRTALVDAKEDRIVSACLDAQQKVPGASLAHYGAGIAWDVRGEEAKSRAAKERALDMEPTAPGYWNGLATHYERAKDDAALKRLRVRYVERFDVKPAW
ncbi:MAG: M12 family metallo-peptidase [Myxococcota bacterium]